MSVKNHLLKIVGEEYCNAFFQVGVNELRGLAKNGTFEIVDKSTNREGA